MPSATASAKPSTNSCVLTQLWCCSAPSLQSLTSASAVCEGVARKSAFLTTKRPMSSQSRSPASTEAHASAWRSPAPRCSRRFSAASERRLQVRIVDELCRGRRRLGQVSEVGNRLEQALESRRRHRAVAPERVQLVDKEIVSLRRIVGLGARSLDEDGSRLVTVLVVVEPVDTLVHGAQEVHHGIAIRRAPGGVEP